MKEVDSRLGEVQVVLLVVLAASLCTLLLLSSCLPPSKTAANETQSAKNVTTAPKVISGKTPMSPGKTTPTAVNTTPPVSLALQPCAVTAETVKTLCGFSALPAMNGCSFNTGDIGGTVTIERYVTTREGYAQKWDAVPGTILLSETEPYEAMNEYQNIKYIWRFEGTTLVVITAARSTCRLDSLRQLAFVALKG